MRCHGENPQVCFWNADRVHRLQKFPEPGSAAYLLFRRELRQDGLRDRDIRYVQLHIFQSLLKEADDAVHWHPVQVLFSFLQDEPVFPPDRDESHIHILQDRRQKQLPDL